MAQLDVQHRKPAAQSQTSHVPGFLHTLISRLCGESCLVKGDKHLACRVCRCHAVLCCVLRAAVLQVDPLDDIDVINLELALADLGQIEKRMDRLKKGTSLCDTTAVTLPAQAVSLHGLPYACTCCALCMPKAVCCK
jgi:hypothetical protein